MSQVLLNEVYRLIDYAPLSIFAARPEDRAYLLQCAENADSELDMPNTILSLIIEARREAEAPAGELDEIGAYV